MYPWLTEYYQRIITAFQQGHSHHALLFKTEQGLGVEQLIQKIGRWLICQNPTDTACQQCHSCHLSQAQNHPDIYQLAPIDNKDIGIDQVREINEKVAQHAQQNGNKIVYILGVQRLTEAAANALLKTLEEPRPNTYFLLQADSSSPIMPTIYSRCQAITILPPPAEISEVWLQQQSAAEFSQIQTALRVTAFRPLQALAILEQNLLEKRRLFLRQFWLFYRRLSPLELLPFFEKEIVLQQIDWLIDFLSDSLKSRLHIQHTWVCQDLTQGVIQFSEALNASKLLRAIQIMQKVRLDLTQINAVNQELILLDGLTRLITEVFEG